MNTPSYLDLLVGMAEANELGIRVSADWDSMICEVASLAGYLHTFAAQPGGDPDLATLVDLTADVAERLAAQAREKRAALLAEQMRTHALIEMLARDAATPQITVH